MENSSSTLSALGHLKTNAKDPIVTAVLHFFKTYRWAFIFSIFYALMATRGGISFLNDIGRINQGWHDWFQEGSPIAGLLYKFFVLQSHPLGFLTEHQVQLADVYPLTTIFGALQVIAGTALLLENINAVKHRIYLKQALACLPLVSPFFLENLSFQFEIVFFGTSILLTCAAIRFLYKDTDSASVPAILKKIIPASIFLSLAIGCYRPIYNIYFSAVLFFAWYCLTFESHSIKQVLKTLGYSAISFLTALIFYKIYCPNLTDWADSHKNIAPMNELAGTIERNFSIFWGMFSNILTSETYYLLSVLVFLGFAAGIFVSYRQFRYNTDYAFFSICLLLMLPIFAIGGVMLIFANPVFSASGMLGTNFFPLFTVIIFWSSFWKLAQKSGFCCKYQPTLNAILTIFVLWPNCLGAAEWSNSRIAQRRLDDKVAIRLKTDLENAEAKYPNAKLTIVGRGPVAPEQLLYENKNAMIKGWSAGSTMEWAFGLPYLINEDIWPDRSKIALPPEMSDAQRAVIAETKGELISRNAWYDLYGSNELIWISFHCESCNRL